MIPLKDYKWIVGNNSYRFIPDLLSTREILLGKLTTDNYDVLIYPPDTADEYLFLQVLRGYLGIK